MVGPEALTSPRRGHFLLESGYHADSWLDLDALFVDSASIEPLVVQLANRLSAYDPTAICGPLLGGAFLAQALARAISIDFFYAAPAHHRAVSGLFTAAYRLPPSLRVRIRGQRVAVVDDVISAGSSVAATINAVADAGATAVVAGAMLVLGDTGAERLLARGIPLEALDRRAFAHWRPEECPLCRDGSPLDDPS